MKNLFSPIFLLIVIFVVISSCAEKTEIPEISVIPEEPVIQKKQIVPEIPVQYRNDNEDFKQSLILLNKVRDLSNPPGSENQISFQLSKEREEEIISSAREGIRLGKLVSDEYLDNIYPGLKDMFRNKMLKGSEIFYDGFMISLNNRDAGIHPEGEQKQIRGVQLQIEWMDWFKKNVKSFGYKVFED